MGRIATSEQVRGEGIGKALMREALAHIGPGPVVLDAQSHLQDLSPLLACLETCEPTLPCLVGDCAEEFKLLYECLEPVMESGACNAALTDCDVAF